MSLLPPLSTNSAKFHNIGDSVTGKLLEIGEEQQTREFSPKGDGDPAYWDKEKTRPKMQRRFLLECTPDPNLPDDDGRRGVYATVSAKAGGMYAAIEQALRGASALGGILSVTFIGTDPESANPQNPRKLYTASYQPPSLLGGAPAAEPAAQQQPAQQAPPAQQQAAAAAAPVDGPPPGLNIDPAAWAAMPQSVRDTVIAAQTQNFAGGNTNGEPPF